ncbi:hypothetical protein GCM10029978_044160 [Actinoallomurus acanthiterrae]
MRPLRALAATAVTVIAASAMTACGGSGPKASADNPYKLLQPGVLRTATLTDAPPNVFLKNGKFTGFDNDLLTAVAAKVGLKVQFAGTDFSALLSQVANHKYDTGSSSITITDARKKTVAFTNGYDFGYFGLDVPAGRRSRASTSSRASASSSSRERSKTTTPPSRASTPSACPTTTARSTS